MTQPLTDETKIEIEDDDEENEESKPEESKSEEKPKLVINKKKVSELNDGEKAQLIEDAKQGIENDFFNVKFNKNGTTRITLKRKTKAQEILSEQKEESGTTTATKSQTKKYLTNDQLLMEHIINLETQYGQLRNKHKKLKKRYNELEGYLYTDENEEQSGALRTSSEPQVQQPEQQIPIQEQPQVQQPQVQPQPIQPQPVQQQQQAYKPVQRRFVRNWRMLNQNQQ